MSKDDRPASRFEALREAWGCPRAPRLWRWHDFQWNVGTRGWWMYCTRCGRPIWTPQ